jgi:nitroreductase
MDLTTIDKLLTTTRTVRKRLDLSRPVEPAVIERCIEIAVQAPTGSNRQNWHFLVITDPDKRAAIASLYRQSFEAYIGPQRARVAGESRDETHQERTNRGLDSATYLAENMQHVPVLVLVCIEGRRTDPSPIAQSSFYGSILPAAWSLMLALRARGLGAAWTTLHLRYEREVADLLGMPDDVTQAALLPVAYYTGDDFRPAKRNDPKSFTYWDTWGVTRD